MNHQPIKTPKGTSLPILDLRGKPYLQVAHRLVWFREDHPDWAITTEFVEINTEKGYAIAKATISGPTVPETATEIDVDIKSMSSELFDGRRRYVIATAHKAEDAQGFGDYLEKAETGAIGRALALCGYGTQFSPDIEEGDRVVDAPVTQAKPAPSKPKASDLPADERVEIAGTKEGVSETGNPWQAFTLADGRKGFNNTAPRVKLFPGRWVMTLDAKGNAIYAEPV